MTALAPEIASHGLALWRLKRSSTGHIRCLVGRFSGKLVLAIHSAGKVLVAESFTDIVPLVKQADAMRAAHLRKGWTDVDSDQDDVLS
jgi:hypothetical protein